jgi:hypothetical protein
MNRNLFQIIRRGPPLRRQLFKRHLVQPKRIRKLSTSLTPFGVGGFFSSPNSRDDPFRKQFERMQRDIDKVPTYFLSYLYAF